MSQNLLDRCLEAAAGRGTDFASEYRPWLPVDLFQTLLVDIHEYAGCSWFAAIDAQLKKPDKRFMQKNVSTLIASGCARTFSEQGAHLTSHKVAFRGVLYGFVNVCGGFAPDG